ncbi:glutamate 5-kinase [Bacteroidota bacterium]
MEYRSLLRDKRRIIIKIGTALLTMEDARIDMIRLERMAGVISGLHESGKEVLLVSSGAVGAGMGKLMQQKKPEKIAEKQALASIGQAALLRMYETFFDEYDKVIGQVLLTRDGIENPLRRRNAKNTLEHLLKMKVIPIINENDTVSTEELEFGDNDMLSSIVAELINADLLIILTNTDGVYTSDPGVYDDAKKLSLVYKDGDELHDVITEGKSTLGSGGMYSKIQAAAYCQNRDIDVIIAEGSEPSVLYKIFDGEDIGTYFISENTRFQG